MKPIPRDILTQYEAVLKKGRFLLPAMRIIGSGFGIILISEANIRFLIPNQNMCVCSSKNCKKKNQTPEQQKQAAQALSLYFEILRKMDNEIPPAQINTKKTVKATSPPPPFIKGESSNNLSRAEATTPTHFPSFGYATAAAYRKQSLLCLSRRVRLRRGMAILRHQPRDHRHGYPFLLCRLENVIMNGVAWRNPTLQIGTLSSIIWRQRSRHGTIPEKRSKPMRSGVANSRASCEISLLTNCQQRT